MKLCSQLQYLPDVIFQDLEIYFAKYKDGIQEFYVFNDSKVLSTDIVLLSLTLNATA